MIVTERSHAGLLSSLHAIGFPPAEQWDVAAMDALLRMPGCFACLYVSADAVPSGMALLRVVADEAELLTIAVMPTARGKGIGAVLLAEGLAEAAQRGAVRIFLEVAPGNVHAYALYQRLGFEPVGRRRGYYADGSDALVLSRCLGP